MMKFPLSMGSHSAGGVAPAPPLLVAYLLDSEYQADVTTLETNAATSAQYALYNGQYVIETFLNAWMATDDGTYLDEAIDYAQAVVAAAVNAVDIDDVTPHNLALPQSSNGAINTGVPYKGWNGSATGWLQQSQFASGVYRLALEVETGVTSGSATTLQQDDVQALVEFVTRDIIEKYLTTSGLYWTTMQTATERAAARDPQGSSFSGYWIDQITFGFLACAYIDYLYPLYSLSVPAWVSNFDYLTMMKIWMQAGPATGPVTGLTLSHGIESFNGKGYLERLNDANKPAGTDDEWGGNHGRDTGHANRWPQVLMAITRMGLGDAAMQTAASDWVVLFENNAAAQQITDGGVLKTAHWQDGTDFAPATKDEHLGFIFPTWTLYAAGNTTYKDWLLEFYEQIQEWVDGGALLSDPTYSFSMHRHSSALAKGALLSAWYLGHTRTRANVWGTLTPS